MKSVGTRLAPWAPYARSLLRIIAGLLLLSYGLLKLFDFPTPPPFPMQPIFYVAAYIELPIGILLTLGLFTRPASFVLSGETAVAFFHSHAPYSIYPIATEGDLPVLFCFTFFYLFFAGGGPVSLDRLIFKTE
jgi:putative oxidoreductase